MLLPQPKKCSEGVALMLLPQPKKCSEGVANFNVMMIIDHDVMMMMMIMIMIMTIVSVEQLPGWGEQFQTRVKQTCTT